MPDKESLKRLELHYERLSKAKNFEEFKREQLAYIHMLIQDYTKKLESKPNKSYNLLWSQIQDRVGLYRPESSSGNGPVTQGD